MKLYHRVNGKVYGPFGGTLEEYRTTIMNAYGNLRGVKIIEAESMPDARAKLLFPQRKKKSK